MSIQPELKTVLKRLKLSGMLPTLPDRLAYARKEKLDYLQFLELVLSDEVERRDQHQREQHRGQQLEVTRPLRDEVLRVVMHYETHGCVLWLDAASVAYRTSFT